jgi:hypothetical protein
MKIRKDFFNDETKSKVVENIKTHEIGCFDKVKKI